MNGNPVTFWSSLSKTTRQLLAATALVSAITPTAWAGYTAVKTWENLQEQVASNTRAIMAFRFFELDKKRYTHDGLDSSEYAQFCELGSALGYFTQCPPPKAR